MGSYCRLAVVVVTCQLLLVGSDRWMQWVGEGGGRGLLKGVGGDSLLLFQMRGGRYDGDW